MPPVSGGIIIDLYVRIYTNRSIAGQASMLAFTVKNGA